MKNKYGHSLLWFIGLIGIASCDTATDKPDIIYRTIDKEIVLITDVAELQNSNDEISVHVDSILSGLLNTEFVSTGQKDFELDEDSPMDIGFEIIDLTKFNPNGLPESFDSLAARVLPLTVEILDNSTFGYPDALHLGEMISGNGNWSNNTSVLGTFMNAGQFQGKGDRYLGIRFVNESNYKYGWIKIYCSQHNDTLRILDFAYNKTQNSQIAAGQLK